MEEVHNADARYQIGKMCAAGILIFEFFSILISTVITPSSTTHFMLIGLYKIAQEIANASNFVTLICISYAIAVITPPKKDFPLAMLFVADIVLANRLYDNARLASIPTLMANLSPEQWIVFVSIAFCMFWFLYWDYTRKNRRREKKKPSPEEPKPDSKPIDPPPTVGTTATTTHESSTSHPTSGVTPQDATPPSRDSSAKSADVQSAPSEPPSVGTLLVILVGIACLAVIFLCIAEIVLKRKFPQFDMTWPTVVPSGGVLHFIALACLIIIILMALFAFFNPVFRRRKKGEKPNITEEWQFRFSTLIAIVLETLFIFFYERMNIDTVTNKLIDALTDNLMTAVFALVVMFLTLQIFVLAIFHFFGLTPPKQDKDKDVIWVFEQSITNIELNIIKIACGVIEGCVALFDFIPDFFDTIGELLLDKESKKPPQKDQPLKKSEPLQETDKRGEQANGH